MDKQYDILIIGGGPGGTYLFEGCIPSNIFHETARRLRNISLISP